MTHEIFHQTAAKKKKDDRNVQSGISNTMEAEGMAVMTARATVANIPAEMEVILKVEERRVEVMLIRIGKN